MSNFALADERAALANDFSFSIGRRVLDAPRLRMRRTPCEPLWSGLERFGGRKLGTCEILRYEGYKIWWKDEAIYRLHKGNIPWNIQGISKEYAMESSNMPFLALNPRIQVPNMTFMAQTSPN